MKPHPWNLSRDHLTYKLILITAIVVWLAGCATGATVEGMKTPPAAAVETVNPALENAITVSEVSGGKETNPLWKSNISSENFQTALTDALRNHRLLGEDEAGYVLEATLKEVKQPLFGASFTVTATVGYRLTERESGKVLFEQDLVTPYTAKLSSALWGPKRLRLANEGAAGANIAALIEELNRLDVRAANVEG